MGIAGYPLNGPLDIEPGRIGKTEHVLTDDAYGNGPVDRTITSLSGVIRHGNSGGPAIDSEGHVQTTVFATKIGEPGGYGVPAEVVRKVLAGRDSAGLDRRCAPVLRPSSLRVARERDSGRRYGATT